MLWFRRVVNSVLCMTAHDLKYLQQTDDQKVTILNVNNVPLVFIQV